MFVTLTCILRDRVTYVADLKPEDEEEEVPRVGQVQLSMKYTWGKLAVFVYYARNLVCDVTTLYHLD